MIKTVYLQCKFWAGVPCVYKYSHNYRPAKQSLVQWMCGKCSLEGMAHHFRSSRRIGGTICAKISVLRFTKQKKLCSRRGRLVAKSHEDEKRNEIDWKGCSLIGFSVSYAPQAPGRPTVLFLLLRLQKVTMYRRLSSALHFICLRPFKCALQYVDSKCH